MSKNPQPTREQVFANTIRAYVKSVLMKYPTYVIENFIENMGNEKKLDELPYLNLPDTNNININTNNNTNNNININFNQSQNQNREEIDHDRDRINQEHEKINKINQINRFDSEVQEENRGSEIDSSSDESHKKKNIRINRKPKKADKDEIKTDKDQKQKNYDLIKNNRRADMIKSLNFTLQSRIPKIDLSQSLITSNKLGVEISVYSNQINQLFSTLYDPQYIYINDGSNKNVTIHAEEFYCSEEQTLCFKLHHIPRLIKVSLDKSWERVLNEAFFCSLLCLRDHTVVDVVSLLDSYMESILSIDLRDYYKYYCTKAGNLSKCDFEDKVNLLHNYGLAYTLNKCYLYNYGDLKVRYPKDVSFENELASNPEHLNKIIGKGHSLKFYGRHGCAIIEVININKQHHKRENQKTYDNLTDLIGWKNQNKNIGIMWIKNDNLKTIIDSRGCGYYTSYQTASISLSDFPRFLKQILQTYTVPLLDGFVYVFMASGRDERRIELGRRVLDLNCDSFVGPYELELLLGWWAEAAEAEDAEVMTEEAYKDLATIIREVKRLNIVAEYKIRYPKLKDYIRKK
eukprot:Mrub_02150.p1 GENE.Mrub_02150~~Mrub_02150.p1  ORF type:complete len:604 (-),score=139.49 Mrub_02150:12-1733(-)